MSFSNYKVVNQALKETSEKSIEAKYVELYLKSDYLLIGRIGLGEKYFNKEEYNFY